MSQASRLSEEDIRRLLDEPSAATRAETAQKIGRSYANEPLSESERAVAEDIFRIMLRDAEIRVRKALADTLKDFPEIPHDVALSLAHDVEDVALPVIESAVVLTDSDLIEILRGGESARQVSVARRRNLSADVSDAIVETDNLDAISTLARNETATIRESTYDRILQRHGDKPDIADSVALRQELPLPIAERLVSLVSESLREHLLTHQSMSPEMATDLVLESRERATAQLLYPGASRTDVLALVDQLYASKRLTPTLIIRALCVGDMTFFEAALARRAHIPVANAHQLVRHRSHVALERLFQKADMPESLLHIARIGVSIAVETNATGGDDREAFRKIVIERILTQLEENIDSDNVDYLIGKLGRSKEAG